MEFEDLRFAAGTKIFVNESLCAYYKTLWSKCKKLLRAKRIASFYTIYGVIRIKVREKSIPINITHHVDLVEHFPDFDFNRR